MRWNQCFHARKRRGRTFYAGKGPRKRRRKYGSNQMEQWGKAQAQLALLKSMQPKPFQNPLSQFKDVNISGYWKAVADNELAKLSPSPDRQMERIMKMNEAMQANVHHAPGRRILIEREPTRMNMLKPTGNNESEIITNVRLT